MPQTIVDRTLDETDAIRQASAQERAQTTAGGVRTAIQIGAQSSPDAKATALQLSDRLKVPVEMVERNPDLFKARAAAVEAERVLADAPKLAAWVQQPHNGGLVHDDLEPLSAVERTLRIGSDAALSLLKGAISIPQSVVGVAGILSGGYVPRVLEDTIGFRPAEAQAALDLFYSDRQRAAFLQVQQASGFVGKAAAALSNPSVIAQSVLESVPLMLGGAGVARGLLKAVPALGGVAAGSIGEGVTGAGLAAEQTRVSNEDRLLTAGQAGLSAASGVGTAAFAILGGKIANKLGIADVDTMLAGATSNPAAARGLTRSLVYGAVSEGLLEEFPQSIQEQVLQNAAQGRPLEEGVADNAVLGLLAGAVMGGGGNVVAYGASAAQRKATAGLVGQQTLEALGKAQDASQTATRSPEKFAELSGHLMASGPLETSYAPTSAFVEYFQSKGLDPAKVAERLTGIPDALAKAIEADIDLAIPTAATTLAPEHRAFFVKELRIGDPKAMTGAESAAFDITAEVAPADGANPAGGIGQTPREQIRAQLEQQLMVGGKVEPGTARTMASVADAAIGTMSEAAGEDPLEVYQRYGLQVQRPVVASSASASSLGTAVSPAAEKAAPATVSAPAVAPDAQGEIPGLAALEADLAGASLEQLDPAGLNASGESAASAEALSRQAGMQARGESFVVYDRAGNARSLIGPEAVDYVARPGETYGVQGPNGFRVLEDKGGKVGNAQAARALDTLRSTAQTAGAHGPEAGNGPADTAGEQPGPDGTGGEQAGGNVAGPQRRRLPTAIELSGVEGASIFVKASAEADTARLTPDVTRELARIAEELGDFPFTTQTWNWDVPDKSGNASGGDANIVAGAAGTPLYDDILNYAPLAKSSKGEGAAKSTEKTRGAVLADVRRTLKTGRIASNVAEGAVRVAERRNADDYRDISRPLLPPTWGIEAPPELTDALSEAIDSALADADVSFDPSEFNQSLFDALNEAGTPAVDTLDTGEQQPRLPGAEAVREQDVATPELDAPFSLTGEVSKATKGKQATLFQDRRASITIDPRTRKMVINLFPKANVSSPLHELGHAFLEIFGDLSEKVQARDPATLTDEQRRLVADYQGVLKELGVTDRSGIGVAQHEQFADSFLVYLREGKAPSVELQGAFTRFRQWLVALGKSLLGVKVEMSDELRGIFARMLASEQAIQEAEQAAGVHESVLTPEMVGKTPDAFARSQQARADAARVAREKLDQQLMSEVAREQTAAWQAQRREVQTQVEQEIYAAPVYQALAALRSGTKPDGTPLVEGQPPTPIKLDRAAIVAQYGLERAAGLPAFITSKEGGLPADVAAELLPGGFASGDALLTALVGVQPMRQAITQETDRRMLEQHGSMLLDGTLHERAQAAVANEQRDAVIRAELSALWALDRSRRRDFVNRVGIPSAALLKQKAEQQIAGLAVKELYGTKGTARPQLYWAAARRAASSAIDAAAKQDFDGAITAKTSELVNLARYRAATQARADIDARVKKAQRLNTTKAQQRLGLAGSTYLEQVLGILDRYEFATVTNAALDKRARVKDWIEALEAQGMPVEGLLPQAVIDDARRVNYKEVTYEELVEITDGLDQILHLARLKNKLLKSADARDFAIVRDALADSIRSKTTARPKRVEFRPSDDRGRTVEAWYASTAKLALLTSDLDGHTDGGPMWEALTRPINAAADAEEARNITEGTAYAALLETHYPGRQALAFNDMLFIPEIGMSLSYEARLSVGQNWGNQSSRDRLLNDPVRQWTEPQIQAILDTLTKNDWEFIQAHWDFLNRFWPEIAAKMKRLTGLEPQKVEALPVETRHGTYPGGYHPLVYDRRLDVRAGQHEAATEAKLGASAAYVRTTTRRGHEEARKAHVTLPIRLDMAVTSRHLAQVIHDLTHHEMLIDTTRILRDPKVSSAILDTQGDITYEKLTKILQDIALGETAGSGAPTILDKGATWMRSRAQIAGMGYNLWTALQQPLGLFNGMERVGPVWVARGMKRWLRDAGSMENTLTFIRGKSLMMASRMGSGATQTQDLHDVRQRLGQAGGWFDRLVRTVSSDHLTQQTILDSYMWHIALAQRVADVPTWLGEYEKQMHANAEDEARAVAMADQAVLDSQGGGSIKDLADVQRGGQVAKLFMTFASYGVTVLNATARAAGRTDFRSPASALRFLGSLSLLYVMPSVLTEMLRCGVGRTECDEAPAFLKKVGGQILGTALNGIILVREVAPVLNLAVGLDPDVRGYEGTAGTRVFNETYQLGRQIYQHELDEALAKAILRTSGLFLKYPAAQVQRTVDGWVALREQRTSNPAALLFGAPVQAEQ